MLALLSCPIQCNPPMVPRVRGYDGASAVLAGPEILPRVPNQLTIRPKSASVTVHRRVSYRIPVHNRSGGNRTSSSVSTVLASTISASSRASQSNIARTRPGSIDSIPPSVVHHSKPVMSSMSISKKWCCGGTNYQPGAEQVGGYQSLSPLETLRSNNSPTIPEQAS